MRVYGALLLGCLLLVLSCTSDFVPAETQNSEPFNVEIARNIISNETGKSWEIKHIPVPSEPFGIEESNAPLFFHENTEIVHLPLPTSSSNFSESANEEQKKVKPEPKPEPNPKPKPKPEPKPEPKPKPDPKPEPKPKPKPEPKPDTKVLFNGETQKAEIGKVFELVLTGGGWIFQGDSVDSEKIELLFVRKKDNDTLFGFRIKVPGSWILPFQKQNNEKGILESYIVNVDSLELNSIVEIEENNAEDNNSVLEDVKYKAESKEELKDILDNQLSGEASDSPVLRRLELELQRNSSRPDLEVVFREWMLDRNFYNSDERAAALYRIAQLYEQSGPFRDIKKAYEYYQKVYTNFPVSPQAVLAEKRMIYLDRHYLKIR